MKRTILSLSIALLSCAALEAATYYVGKTGNDATGIGSGANPYFTIAKGLSKMVGGDTLKIGDGTYTEMINNTIPSGKGSWDKATLVEAVNPRRVTLKPTGIYPMSFALRFTDTTSSWIWVKGLVVDADNLTMQCLRFDYSTGPAVTGYPHHIRIENCDLKNAGTSTVHMGGAVPTIPRNLHCHDCELINCDIHGAKRANSTTPPGHGVYCSSRNHVFRGCRIYENGGFGIQFSVSSGAVPEDNLVEGCTIYNNGVIPSGNSGPGIGIANANRITIRNNVIYGHARGPGISAEAGKDSWIYHNTIYGNTGGGIIFTADSSKNNVIRNNIVYANTASTQISVVSGNTVDHNTTTDPSFVDSAAKDFHLKSTSVAINAGYDLSGSLAADFDGVTRPYGGGWDCGAFEYITGTATSNKLVSNVNQPEGIAVRPFATGAISIAWRGNSTANTVVYSLNGQRLASFDHLDNQDAIWSPGKSSAGVYLLRTESGKTTQTVKVLLGR